MISRLLRATALLVLISNCLQAAAVDAVDPAVEKKLRQVLTRPDLGLGVGGVEKSEMPGIYAVKFINGPIVYSSEDGSFFFVGDLHQVTPEGFENLTERRRDEERLEQIAAIKAKDMIVFPAEGETRAYVNVFTDVTCFYCQKLHLEVPELNRQGVEVRYLAYPRAGLDSPGYRKLATAWCAKDQQDTLTRLKAKESVKEDVCEPNPISQQFKLGQSIGVRGTPAIVTAEGRLIPGYQPASELMVTIGLE